MATIGGERVEKGAVVCLGFFDGVHRGHLALVEAAKHVAAEKGLILCAHTFSSAPGKAGESLTSLPERIELLRAAGAEQVFVSPFDEQMRRMSGPDFFEGVLLHQLHARHLVCGDDHRFGYRGAWGVGDLRRMCDENGVGLTVVPPVTLPNGQKISTTALRAALSRRDWQAAEEMLGREIPRELMERFQTPETETK